MRILFRRTEGLAYGGCVGFNRRGSPTLSPPFPPHYASPWEASRGKLERMGHPQTKPGVYAVPNSHTSLPGCMRHPPPLPEMVTNRRPEGSAPARPMVRKESLGFADCAARRKPWPGDLKNKKAPHGVEPFSILILAATYSPSFQSQKFFVVRAGRDTVCMVVRFQGRDPSLRSGLHGGAAGQEIRENMGTGRKWKLRRTMGAQEACSRLPYQSVLRSFHCGLIG